MPARAFVLLLLAVCTATPAQTGTAPQTTTLADRVDTLLRDAAVASAHWGIAVSTLDGTPVYGMDEGKLFRPASTAKLFTTAGAMALLGPGHQFKTQVYGDLDAASGTVRGDLTLLGGGDPSFGTHDLPYTRHTSALSSAPPAQQTPGIPSLAAALTAAGVTAITGDIIGNDTLFENATVPDGWAEEDLLWGYGTLPSALSIADNELRLTVHPKPAGPVPGHPSNWIGSYATVDQLFSYLQVLNEVTTQPQQQGNPDSIGVQAVPGAPLSRRLFGRLSPNAAPAGETLALPEPAAYAAGALRMLLLQDGIRVDGQATSLHRPPPSYPTSFVSVLRQPGCEASLWGGSVGCVYYCLDTPHATHLIAEVTSPPLSEDVAFTLKTSANLHAELFLHHLGLLASCPGVTTAVGARVLRNWLLHIGLQDRDFVLYDGSGLSTKDLVTPRAEAQLLAYAASQPWFPAWKAALPIGGVDGTLANRFTGSDLKGRVFAKTGTLGESRALAGYVRCASGQELIFSILVDNHDPTSSADRATMDQIVAAIAATN